MYPDERSLVKRLEGKPFVLLGVNSDQDWEKLKEVARKEGITWRSWWDGSKRGPIDSRWNVHGWPTFYLLDHKGVIRAKTVESRPADRLIEELLREQEKDAR